MSTMARVRQAISLAHDAIEQTDFAKSLMDGRITRPAYALYLSQMWHIHGELEQQLVSNAAVKPFVTDQMLRTAAIERDARALGQGNLSAPPLDQTIMITTQLRSWGAAMPHALLGCLYILEGSRMGSLLIGKALMRTFALNDSAPSGVIAGVEYHLEDARNTPARVKSFKQSIDQAALSTLQEYELTHGACQFMQLLLQLYSALPVERAGSPVGSPMLIDSEIVMPDSHGTSSLARSA